MKIGIMGGTFDPVHNGHLMLGHAAYETFSLDQIWFMPNGMPPHKKQSSIESDIHERIAMTRIAIKANKQFYLQEYEAKREKVSYSYKTMEHFRKMYPDDEFYFIIEDPFGINLQTFFHSLVFSRIRLNHHCPKSGKSTKLFTDPNRSACIDYTTYLKCY